MKVTRVLVLAGLSSLLSACLATGSNGQTSKVGDTTPAPVVVKSGKSANKFQLYVGSTTKGTVKTTSKKGKKTTTNTANQDVAVNSGNVTYYTTGPVVSQDDVRTAFVAKTSLDQPALALRLNGAGNARLNSALQQVKSATVLASMNDSVFSTVNSSGAKLEDGVLLLPMPTLLAARDAADLIRKNK